MVFCTALTSMLVVSVLWRNFSNQGLKSQLYVWATQNEV